MSAPGAAGAVNAAHPNNPFDGLPAELRAWIFGRMLEDVNFVRVRAKGKVNLVSNVRAHSFGRKLDRDFTDNALRNFAITNAKIIVGEVHDFDFSSLIAFLNLIIKQANLSAFGKQNKPRQLYVNLSISMGWLRNPGTDGLVKWERWLKDKVKKGHAFDFSYRVKDLDDKELTDEVMADVFFVMGEDSPLYDVYTSYSGWSTYGRAGQDGRIDEGGRRVIDATRRQAALQKARLEEEREHNLERPGMVSEQRRREMDIAEAAARARAQVRQA